MRREGRNSAAKILIAAENRQNSEVLGQYLADAGFQTDTAEDGQAAMAAVARWKPDLIVLDIRIPGLDACDVCQRLKANPETRTIPIVMLAAPFEVGDIEKAVTAGANDLLKTPVNKLELATRVRSLLQRSA
jgi:two-component system alkaline phosphatase synthesis response regulator PhoP